MRNPNTQVFMRKGGGEGGAHTEPRHGAKSVQIAVWCWTICSVVLTGSEDLDFHFIPRTGLYCFTAVFI